MLWPKIREAIIGALLNQSQLDGLGIGPDPAKPLYVLRLHRTGYTRPTNNFRRRLEGLLLRRAQREWLHTFDAAVLSSACAQVESGCDGTVELADTSPGPPVPTGAEPPSWLASL